MGNRYYKNCHRKSGTRLQEIILCAEQTSYAIPRLGKRLGVRLPVRARNEQMSINFWNSVKPNFTTRLRQHLGNYIIIVDVRVAEH